MSADIVTWVFWGFYASVGLVIFGLVIWWALRDGIDTAGQGAFALAFAGLAGASWLLLLLLALALAPPVGLAWLIGKGLATLSRHIRAEAKA